MAVSYKGGLLEHCSNSNVPTNQQKILKCRFRFSGSWRVAWDSSSLTGPQARSMLWPDNHTWSHKGLRNLWWTLTVPLLNTHLSPSLGSRLWVSFGNNPLPVLCFYFGSNGPQCLGRKQVTWVCSIPDPGYCGRLEAGPGSVGCRCKRSGWADTSSTQLFTFWSFPGVPSLTEAQALPSAI